MKKVNVYDFDGTIYDGDSSVDFLKFAIRNKWTICIKIIPIAFVATLYIFGFKDKKYFKSKFFSFISKIDDLDLFVKSFWDKNEKRIKDFYLKNRRSSDYIVSASPDFLIEEIAKRNNANFIATKVDRKTGKLLSENCYGKEKVKRFKKTNLEISKFYSDSISDSPMANISEKAFMVKGNKIIAWSEYKESIVEKIKKILLSRNFIIFVAIGAINAFNGVWLALVYRNVIETELLSYSAGFFTSAIIAYILNSLFNFHKKINFKDAIKYLIGNFPNYIIQVLIVFVFIDMFKWERVPTYIFASILSVPITFCIIKIMVYNKK